MSPIFHGGAAAGGMMSTVRPASAFPIGSAGRFGKACNVNRRGCFGTVERVAGGHDTIFVRHQPGHLAAVGDHDMAGIASAGAVMIGVAVHADVVVVAVGTPACGKGGDVRPVGGVGTAKNVLIGRSE